MRQITLRSRIAGILRRQIQTKMAPGDRLDAEAKLAKRFDVSIMTVRHAILKLCEEGYLRRRPGSGTYVTSVSGHAQIGVVIEADISHPQTSYFYLRLVQTIRAQLADRQFTSQLYAGHTPWGSPQPATLSCEEFYRAVEQNRIAGVIAIASHTTDKWWEPLAAQGIPVVGDGPPFPVSVGVNHQQLVRRGVRYLLQQGCERIALMDCGSPGTGSVHETGFREELADKGQTPHPDYLQFVPEANLFMDGAQAFERLWNQAPRPDGVMICNDLLFEAAIPACHRLGVQIPQDMHIVAHHNRGNPRTYLPGVVRATVDVDRVSQAMVGRLCDLLEKKPIEEQHTQLDALLEVEPLPVIRA